MITLHKIYCKTNQLLSKKVDIKDGYKAISLDGKSTCTLTSNRKSEIEFNMNGINAMPKTAIISPHVKGYHFCEFLSEVLLYRPYNEKIDRTTNEIINFQYYKIKVSGECYKERNGPTIVTNEFEFEEALDKNKMLSILNGEKDIFINYNKKKKKKHYQKMIKFIDDKIEYLNKI